MPGRNSQATDWKETRRKRAVELFDLGWRQIDIAEALGVSQAAVSQWLATAHQQGAQALCSTPRPTGPRKLAPEQLDALPDLLWGGTKAYGFFGEVWTCARVATVIRREFGVSYHKAHVSRLLKQLRWTPQKPIQRAAQGDDLQIARWRTDVWPELKKRR